MKRVGVRYILLACIAFMVSLAQLKAQGKTALIPYPVSLKQKAGHFRLTTATRIVLPVGYNGASELISSFQQRLQEVSGYNLKVVKKYQGASIKFLLVDSAKQRLGRDGYTLDVSSRQILIAANHPRGWFYAMQTLMQMLPRKIESTYNNGVQASNIIPCVSIADSSRFSWRGLMVDVSRHFFSKQVVLRYIDQMAKYKFNVLHLHLTDNQGWRLEINSLPKLTSVGAWRVPRTGYWKGFAAPQPGEAATDGGYYTRQDIREIVDYAAKRFVTIVPEIDVPGHSLALIAAYPELSCTKQPQQVLAGDPWNIKRTNVLCVGNDSVYLALDKVLTEVAAMFPGKYIHIGGDEVIRTYWDNCPRCQQRIKDEHLKSSEELQAYFIKRVAAIVKSKGKEPIGWYENLEGKLVPGIAVMSWKSAKGGVVASNAGSKVVMTPAEYTYLDFYQGEPLMENGPFTVCRISTCYKFEPVASGASAENILGGQGSLWTEQVANERKLQAMTWPRALALAEILWSPKKEKNWPEFAGRLESVLPQLDADQVNYSKSMYEPIITAKKVNDKVKIRIDTEESGLKVYYTFDDTDVDNFYPEYKGELLDIPTGAHHIRAVSYKNGRPIGRQLNIPLAEVEKRARL